MPEVVQIGDEFYNVKETYPLYDTILITGNLSDLSIQPPGWFASFAAFAAAQDYHFFDTRNKAGVGIAYCNLDTRDTMPFGYWLRGMSVKFFGPVVNTLYDNTNDLIDTQEGAFFSGEAPQHCGVTLRVNQDQRLKLNALMLGAGDGATFGGYGQIDPAAAAYNALPGMMGITQSNPEEKNYWMFPMPIGIPRRASVSVIITPMQWLRTVMGNFHGPLAYSFADTGESRLYPYGIFGIRVCFYGNRLVQQRGQLHA